MLNLPLGMYQILRKLKKKSVVCVNFLRFQCSRILKTRKKCGFHSVSPCLLRLAGLQEFVRI